MSNKIIDLTARRASRSVSATPIDQIAASLELNIDAALAHLDAIKEHLRLTNTPRDPDLWLDSTHDADHVYHFLLIARSKASQLRKGLRDDRPSPTDLA